MSVVVVVGVVVMGVRRCGEGWRGCKNGTE